MKIYLVLKVLVLNKKSWQNFTLNLKKKYLFCFDSIIMRLFKTRKPLEKNEKLTTKIVVPTVLT